MPSRRLTISVPKPCHEEWHAMTPENQGRYCQSCATTVVDFTQMSDAEVVAWLSENKNIKCGKFREEQLGRTLISEPKTKSTWTVRAIFLGLAMWFGKNSAEAQKLPSQRPEIEILKSSESSVLAATTDIDTTVISGVIVATPKGGSSQIKIRLNDTAEVNADASGRFKITFFKDVPLEKQWLVLSAIGHQTQRFRLSEFENLQGIRIALLPDNVNLNLVPGVLGGISVSGVPTRSTNFPLNVFNRIEDFFR